MSIAAAITAAGALTAAGISAWNARRMAKKQLRASRENWQMENAYNNPSAQMARLRAAGLNPNLIYQNGAENVSGSIESPQYDSGIDTSGLTQIGSTLIQDRQQQAQQSQIDAYIHYLDSLTRKTSEEATNVSISNKWLDKEKKQGLANMEYNGTLMQEQGKLYREQRNLVAEQVGLTAQQVDTYRREFSMRMFDLQSQMNLRGAQINEINKHIEQMAQEIVESKTRGRLNEEYTYQAVYDALRAKVMYSLEEVSANYKLDNNKVIQFIDTELALKNHLTCHNAYNTHNLS